jgi:hypothetical protein
VCDLFPLHGGWGRGRERERDASVGCCRQTLG